MSGDRPRLFCGHLSQFPHRVFLLDSNTRSGLSRLRKFYWGLSEAKAAQRLKHYGASELSEPPRRSLFLGVTMVTGDCGLTAKAIAHQIGLADRKVRVVTGENLRHLCDTQLRRMLQHPSGLVFARMLPEQKLRLAQAYKDLGYIALCFADKRDRTIERTLAFNSRSLKSLQKKNSHDFTIPMS
ncbi:hypothetical protein [Altericista sp. CCNU0014]|uniref:hypothetical protein n=1 Tax=Altericista sp. CCNU0014 TaxID=3082949 RepID=UPI00384D2615